MQRAEVVYRSKVASPPGAHGRGVANQSSGAPPAFRDDTIAMMTGRSRSNQPPAATAQPKSDITPDGIEIHQSKDGKHIIMAWTDSLRKVVRRGLERSQCIYVFTNEYGRKLTKSCVQASMSRMKAATGVKWRFHDIRAKAESDHATGLGLMSRYKRATKLKAVR